MTYELKLEGDSWLVYENYESIAECKKIWQAQKIVKALTFVHMLGTVVDPAIDEAIDRHIENEHRGGDE